ncbi:hypothetical protein ACFLYU_02135 [Candidatus Dependentiae bacterium]
MRQPLWILNSILFGLILVVLLFVFFSGVTIEDRETIEPDASRISVVKEPARINIKKIYEPEDLFGTYKKELPQIEERKYVRPLPSPPRPAPVRIPQLREPKFFDPLDITLKGIVSVGNGTDSSAIISNNKTKREAVYQVGDKIEDAQLIRIFNSKVIFVRSNSQQEVFYLREQDAQSDPMFLNIDNWDGIVKKGGPNKYLVSPSAFASRVKNLAQFIDLLGLTSAYHQGKSVGCRIGEIVKDSLGQKLGLATGDIVVLVAGIKPTTTKNRLKIYNKVTLLKEKDSVEIKLQRRRDTYTLHYKLEEFRPSEKRVSLSSMAKITPEQMKKDQEKMLKSKYSFAPTEREIKRRERQNMFGRGSKPVTRRKSKFAE